MIMKDLTSSNKLQLVLCVKFILDFVQITWIFQCHFFVLTLPFTCSHADIQRQNQPDVVSDIQTQHRKDVFDTVPLSCVLVARREGVSSSSSSGGVESLQWPSLHGVLLGGLSVGSLYWEYRYGSQWNQLLEWDNYLCCGCPDPQSQLYEIECWTRHKQKVHSLYCVYRVAMSALVILVCAYNTCLYMSRLSIYITWWDV